MAITLDMKCKKCEVTLRRQALMAMAIDAGAQTLDPALCPNGGDHEFEDTIPLNEQDQERQADAQARG